MYLNSLGISPFSPFGIRLTLTWDVFKLENFAYLLKEKVD